MKPIIFTLIFSIFAIANAQQCDFEPFSISAKSSPSLHEGSIRGLNAGIEAGLGRVSLNILAHRIFPYQEYGGHSRIEIQPRYYYNNYTKGLFFAFSYMRYGNQEQSIGGMAGYKFPVVNTLSMELFSGIQSNSSYEMTWDETPIRLRGGIALSFGKFR